ncbi:MAG: hypothetical protein ABI831_26705, partial [Betaproteobacteria bacterium]
GVEVKLRATGSNVEKIFTVQPGADPGAIRMAIDGAETLRIDVSGALQAATGNGEVGFTPPVAYQTIAGRQTAVPVRYALGPTAGTYGFTVGAYDATQPLVIDPLLQATYFGGNSSDAVFDMVIHPISGEIIVAGETFSTTLPCTTAGGLCATGAQSTHAMDMGDSDGFVVRLSADLTQLRQATYLGGTEGDGAQAVAVDPASGEILVAGYTFSTNFPCTTAGGICAAGAQSAHGGGLTDGFVARLSPNLTQLRQATYFGGSQNESIVSLAFHPASGEILVAGNTTSTDLPCTTAGGICGNGAQKTHIPDGGKDDGFVARLSADLTQLRQATYFGGNDKDSLNVMAVNPANGEIVIAGFTYSSNLTCAGVNPCGSPAQELPATLPEGFLTRLTADLTGVLQTTYLGGNSNDAIVAVAFHPANGDIFVAGGTLSTDFPCTAVGGGCSNGAQSANASPGGVQFDGFVARLSSDLTQLKQSTYFGGDKQDLIWSLAVHPATGEIIVGGDTQSVSLPCTLAGGACLVARKTLMPAPEWPRTGSLHGFRPI